MRKPNTKNSETPCQYLYSSTQELIDAFQNYSDLRSRDTLKSLSYIHKAWDSLWITDTMLNQPNCFIEDTDNGHRYTLSACLNKFSEHPNYESIFLGPDKHKMQDNKETHYYPLLSTGLFGQLRYGLNNPFYQNLDLIRRIRNHDQHVFVKPLDNYKSSLVQLMNPYLLASLSNYFTIYEIVLEQTKADCKSHRRSDRCDRSFLPSLPSLIQSIMVPQPLSELFDEVKNQIDTKQIAKKIPIIANALHESEEKTKQFHNDQSITLLRKPMNPYSIYMDYSINKHKALLNEYSNYDFSNKGKKTTTYTVEQVSHFFKDFKHSNLQEIVDRINLADDYPYIVDVALLKKVLAFVASLLNLPHKTTDNIFVWSFFANNKEIRLYSKEFGYFVTTVLISDDMWLEIVDKIPLKRITDGLESSPC